MAFGGVELAEPDARILALVLWNLWTGISSVGTAVFLATLLVLRHQQRHAEDLGWILPAALWALGGFMLLVCSFGALGPGKHPPAAQVLRLAHALTWGWSSWLAILAIAQI